MPSPFPGMDPYLENPTSWPSLHHGLISEIQAELNVQLRPEYRASIEQRVYISDEDDPGRDFIIPDVHVVQRHGGPRSEPPERRGKVLIKPIDVTTLIYDEVQDNYIQIIDPSDRAVITVIEIVSPTNKLIGSYGRRDYLQKRRAVLRSTSHFIEIDLLRAGRRIPVPERLPAHDYLVGVHRMEADDSRRSQVWPIPIYLPLPVIPVPLKPQDAAAQLDLQKMFQVAFERGGYDIDLDYTRDPVPPLTPEQANWARQLVNNASTR